MQAAAVLGTAGSPPCYFRLVVGVAGQNGQFTLRDRRGPNKLLGGCFAKISPSDDGSFYWTPFGVSPESLLGNEKSAMVTSRQLTAHGAPRRRLQLSALRTTRTHGVFTDVRRRMPRWRPIRLVVVESPALQLPRFDTCPPCGWSNISLIRIRSASTVAPSEAIPVIRRTDQAGRLSSCARAPFLAGPRTRSLINGRLSTLAARHSRVGSVGYLL
jgi:hypothetical protein